MTLEHTKEGDDTKDQTGQYCPIVHLPIASGLGLECSVKWGSAMSSTHLMEGRNTKYPRSNLDITTLGPPHALLTREAPLALTIRTFGIKIYRI